MARNSFNVKYYAILKYIFTACENVEIPVNIKRRNDISSECFCLGASIYSEAKMTSAKDVKLNLFRFTSEKDIKPNQSSCTYAKDIKPNVSLCTLANDVALKVRFGNINKRH